MILTAIAIFAGFFAFSWIIACSGNRVGRVPSEPGSREPSQQVVSAASGFDPIAQDQPLFNGRPRCGSGAANKRRQLLGYPSLSHGGEGNTL